MPLTKRHKDQVECEYDGLIYGLKDVPNKKQYYDSTQAQAESIMTGGKWNGETARGNRTARQVYNNSAQGVLKEEFFIQCYGYKRVSRKIKNGMYNDLICPITGETIEVKTRRTVSDEIVDELLLHLRKSSFCEADYMFLSEYDAKSQLYTFIGKFKI